MKTRAGIRYFLTAASLAAALAMQMSNSFGQDTKADAKAQATAKAAMRGYDLVISDGVLFETNGERSTAEIPAVMDVLRKRYPDANIVIAPELSQVNVADLKLHAHDLPEMLEAVRVASGNKFDWSGPNSSRPGAIDPATGLPLAGAQADLSSGLFTLRPVEQTVEQAKGAERVVEAFNIGPFLEHKISEARSRQPEINRDELQRFSMAITDREVHDLQENIVSTVASFKQTDEGSVRTTLKFQYHSGASLLVAIGPRADVEVARKMMGALVSDPSGVRVDRIRTDLTDMQGEENFQPVSVEAIPVKSAKLESAYAAAMSLLADKRSKVVLTDARSKTLIVQATKAEVVAIRAAIEQLDQASRQPGAGSSGGSSGSVPQKDH
jgi:hypothetical protein